MNLRLARKKRPASQTCSTSGTIRAIPQADARSQGCQSGHAIKQATYLEWAAIVSATLARLTLGANLRPQGSALVFWPGSQWARGGNRIPAFEIGRPGQRTGALTTLDGAGATIGASCFGVGASGVAGLRRRGLRSDCLRCYGLRSSFLRRYVLRSSIRRRRGLRSGRLRRRRLRSDCCLRSYGLRWCDNFIARAHGKVLS